jgi:hypothetical protein
MDSINILDLVGISGLSSIREYPFSSYQETKFWHIYEPLSKIHHIQVSFLTGMNSISEIRTMFAAEVHHGSSMDASNFDFDPLLFVLESAYIEKQNNAFFRR